MHNFYMTGEKGLPKGWLELPRKGMETKLARQGSLFMNIVCKCVTFTCTLDKGLLKGWLELMRKEIETKLAILEGRCTTFTCNVDNGLLKGWLTELMRLES
jgi:hypothetical protein